MTSANNQDQKTRINFNACQRVYKDFDSLPETYNPSYEEEISAGTNIELKISTKQNENIFIITMGNRVRLVLYKRPNHLSANVKGGESRNVHISSWKEEYCPFREQAPGLF